MTRWLLLFVAMLTLLATEQERRRFAVRTDLVSVDVLVTDGGRPVRRLGLEDFEVRDNGVVQR